MTPDERRRQKCDAVMQLIASTRSRPTKSVRQIVAEVAERHGITINLMFSHSRQEKLSLARHEAMYEAYREAGATLPQIALVMRRDHTSVLHGIRQHQARLEGRIYRRERTAAYCPDITTAPKEYAALPDPVSGKIHLRTLTDAMRDQLRREIKRRRTKGESWKSIAREMMLHERTVRCLVDENYRVAAFARNRESKRISYHNRKHRSRRDHVAKGELSHSIIPMEPRIDPVVVAARRAEIPVDTRTPAQVLMGDPIPARSALAMRHG